jgi:UPF0716 family protein affecting phage T7 exclusion
VDSYGVVTVGQWLFSVPGLLVYLIGVFLILLWSRDRPVWEFILSTVMYNVAWNMLGLSFMVRA